MLDHSISGQILSDGINILCLKPIISGDDIKGLEIHFPNSWSDVGQVELPDKALVSKTLFLSEKSDFTRDKIDLETVLEIACDLIVQDAWQFKSSGFFVLWRNGMEGINGSHLAGITIYSINPLVFLPQAKELGYPLNENSVLYKYLNSFVSQYGVWHEPGALLGTIKRAEEFLGRYFNLRWGISSNWISDARNSNLFLERRVLEWNSWGTVGYYVRNFYLHSREWFADSELKVPGGYQNPFIGFQIINYLTGNTVFKRGYFNNQEILMFGVEIGLYRYACLNAKDAGGERKNMADALLMWSAMTLSHSLKEVGFRVNDSPSIKTGVTFPLAIQQENIYDDYYERIENYIKWFAEEFINSEQNPTVAFIFRLGVDAFQYFDNYFEDCLSETEISHIEGEMVYLIRVKVQEIAVDRLKNRQQNHMTLESLNSNYFDGNLYSMNEAEIRGFLERIPNSFLARSFQSIFLTLLDSLKKGLFQELEQQYLPKNTDWQAMYESAEKFFQSGDRKTAILISPTGEIGLGKIESLMSLNSKEEILIQFNAGNTWVEMTVKEQWKKILDRTSRFFK